MKNNSLEQKFNKYIIAVSIVIPVVVAILFKIKLKDFGIDVAPLSFLPPIYATTNGLTAVLLVAAVVAIKNGNRKWHQYFMTTAIALSLAFLVMYVAYHMTSDSTVFGDSNHNGLLEESEKVSIGSLRIVYILILITHIILSIAIIPMVLITYVRAIGQDFVAHKKISKITFPIWLYVAVTGVIVYLMIAPYYSY
jgi:putative membrane protein